MDFRSRVPLRDNYSPVENAPDTTYGRADLDWIDGRTEYTDDANNRPAFV